MLTENVLTTQLNIFLRDYQTPTTVYSLFSGYITVQLLLGIQKLKANAHIDRRIQLY